MGNNFGMDWTHRRTLPRADFQFLLSSRLRGFARVFGSADKDSEGAERRQTLAHGVSRGFSSAARKPCKGDRDFGTRRVILQLCRPWTGLAFCSSALPTARAMGYRLAPLRGFGKIGFGQRVREFIPRPIGGRFEFAGIDSRSMSPQQDPFYRHETPKDPANSKRPQIGQPGHWDTRRDAVGAISEPSAPSIRGSCIEASSPTPREPCRLPRQGAEDLRHAAAVR